MEKLYSILESKESLKIFYDEKEIFESKSDKQAYEKSKIELLNWESISYEDMKKQIFWAKRI